MQAWKKTAAYLRTHSWYADTLGIDYQALRIPDFIAELREELEVHAVWKPEPLELVPAPKTQRWHFDEQGRWVPRPNQGYQKKLRPLAHVSLRDQVVATAIMLCLADRVETRMGDPRVSITPTEDRRRVLAYGHRLLCDSDGSVLRHRWGSAKLYRQFFQDYQTFLRRPRVAAELLEQGTNNFEIAIVQGDLSKFYDRVQPELLRQKLEQLRQEGDDPRFFELAGRVFDWRWADTARAERHGREGGLDGFMEVALPQGLVVSGFFANVVMLDFERRLRDAFDTDIDAQRRVTLLDAAYYVDDLRLVVRIPKGERESVVQATVSGWLQRLLDETASGLQIEPSKTAVTVEGRDRRFLVPQSRAAHRIQSDVSGVFDMLHGTELIGAIEGFFHTQKRYSTETTHEDNGRTGLLIGLSDMRDETAARFAAGRFRRTFRSLRPLLEDSNQPAGAGAGEEEGFGAEDDDASEQSIVLSKVQLDDRAKVFAALLIEEWTANPANVRLMRVALDMYPDKQFLDEVLRILRPSWETGSSKGARREIRVYCLAELFRAGATETGMVSDDECLPHGVSLVAYHERLLDEARAIFDQFVAGASPTSRLPWYLMQQVFLYLSAQNAFPASLANLRTKGGPLLALYRRFAKFLDGERPASLDERVSFLVIARTGFSLAEVVRRVAAQGVSAEFLARLDGCAPSVAAEVWGTVAHEAGISLRQTAERIGLKQRERLESSQRILPDIAIRPLNPFFFEPNILHLAAWLFDLPPITFETPLTPWQIECADPDAPEGEFGKLNLESLRVQRSVSTASHLFAAPEWCETVEDRRRCNIGALLRYAIRGTTDLYAPATKTRTARVPRYARTVSHWQQLRYAGFQGRSAFGPAWLPISSFVEGILFELLRWPGSGVTTELTGLDQLANAVNARLNFLRSQFGKHSRTLFLEQRAPLPYKVKGVQSWGRPLRIGVVQTVLPDTDDFLRRATDPELVGDPAFRRSHRAHLAAALEGVNQMRRVRDTHRSQSRGDRQTIDLLVLPELAVHPDDVRPLLVPFARKHRCILLFGMVYHREPRLPGESLINSCQWLIPEWTRANGFQLRTVEQGKLHLTADEKNLVPPPTGFRPAQWLIEYLWSSDVGTHRPLTMTASVCYDATDLTLAADLRPQSDLYIICALNRDVGTFDRMSDALHYHMYQGVLLVNNGQFGGSSFFMPFEKPFHRQVFHLHGQPQVAIAFAEICPEKLLSRPRPPTGPELRVGRRHDDAPPEGSWKTPPAGWSYSSTMR